MTARTDPPPHARPGGRELLIRHTHADGTLLSGTTRADDLYRLLRSLGWLYRRSAADYRLQASLDRPAKRGRIEDTAAELRARGFAVAVDIDNTVRTAEDAEADRATRATDRADRLQVRAERLRDQAAGKHAAGRRVLDHIPPGQPYLVDHHGYAADRRRRERAIANLDRAHQLTTHAEHTQRQAEVARDHMRYRHTPETVANRIRDIEAELRATARTRAAGQLHARLLARGIPCEKIPAGLTELTPDAERDLADREAHLNEQLAHWRTIRAQQITDGTATNYTRDHIHTGDLILHRGTWYPVLRVNTLTVTVPSFHGAGTGTIRYEHLRGHTNPDHAGWQEARAAAITAAYRFAGAAGPHPAIKALAESPG